MAIPKYTAQRPMEVIPTGAKAFPEMMSRERRAMAGFGGTMMSVSLRWQAERDNSEISRLQSAINNFQYTTLRQLEDDWRSGKFTNADQFKQAEEDYVKARDRMVSKLTKGKRGIISDRVNEYAESNKASDTAGFYRNLFSKEKEFRSVEALKVIENYKLQGERDKALMAIEQNKYWLGLTRTEVLKANLDADMAAIQHQNFLEQIALDTREMPIDDALNLINQIPRTAITETERNGLIRQRERQEEIATATTEPKVYWDTLRKVTIDPDGTTEEYMASLVGKGLTTDDYKEFMGIKESNETVSSNTFWKSEAWNYIERQILEVSTLTGILHGSGEQFALSAQAHIAFEKALGDAVKEKKPIKGSAILELAHEIMLPFRKRIKPLMPGEKLPETLDGRKVSPEYKPPLIPPTKPKTTIENVVDTYPKPKTVEEFENTFRHISDKTQRKLYYDKWADEVYK